MADARQNHPVPGVSGTSAGLCAAKNGKKPNEINAVPGVPDKTTTFPCVCVRAQANTRRQNTALMRVSARHTRHIRHIFDSYRFFGKLTGTASGTPLSNPAQAFLEKKMTPHGFIETLEAANSKDFAWAKGFVDDGVVFHAGDVASVPFQTQWDMAVRPPFQCTLVHSTDSKGTHVLIGCSEDGPGFWQCFGVSQWVGGPPQRPFQFFVERQTGRISVQPGMEHMLLDARDMASMLQSFFAVIACSNVRMVDVPAPEALNKKRARTGKPLIKSHKVLHIVAPSSYAKTAPLGGTHSSPRVHLRRGHIRKLPTGLTVWVQQCVVGSKTGIVTKDYRVSYAQQVAA